MEVREPCAQYLARPAFKQTETGVIPEDWGSVSLGDLKPFVTSGSRGWASYYSEHGSLFVRISNLSRDSIYLDLGDSKFVKLPPRVNEGIRTQLNEHDVLISITADIGIVGYVDTSIPTPAYINQHIALVRLDQAKTCGKFISYFLASENTQKLFRASTDTGAKAGMSLAKVLQIQTALPPLAEQRAIAGALSDVDALLDGLDRLIAKKRDLKQAAMQQLLTGRTRLPGFSGDWKMLNMAEKSTLKARIGWQGLTTAEYLQNGQFFLVTGTDFFNGRVAWSSCCFVAYERYAQDRNIQLRSGDILLTKDGTIGKVGFIDCLPGPATLNSGVFVIRPKDNAYDPRFLYYVLSSRIFDDFLNRLQAGSTISHLYQKDFVTFSFLAPATDEQTAIAAVLSDMDAELAALEARRDKTRALKQAMMQELLTGRIRLV
jgi:type I restriction enzyme S subunit